VSAWKLTVRHGSDVAREEFDDLDLAVAEAERRAEAIRAEGPLEEASGLRDFSPATQVHARIEISGKGLLRPPTAGVDVHGDGSLVAFSGSVRREEVKASQGQSPFDAVRAALRREPR
jgi:hypothetical protein